MTVNTQAGAAGEAPGAGAAQRGDEAALAAAGLDRLPVWKRLRMETVLFVFSLAVAGAVVRLTLAPGTPKSLVDAVTAVLAALAVALGYVQWRAARNEISFDKYYDRLELANARFGDARRQALRDDPAGLESHLEAMFVFAELDNLEYMLGKYRLGYVRQGLALRAVRTFRSRCENTPGFCAAATHWVGPADDAQVSKGYEAATARAVRAIVARAQGAC